MACSDSFNFKTIQRNLCDAIARLARHLSTSSPNSQHLNELLACRLIPLDKKPGVRPIGIGEILHRIIGKCIMLTLKVDIEGSVGGLPTCAGQKGGIEATIHATKEIYCEDKCEGLLMVDASNAFNSLNYKVAMKNIKLVCPNLSQYIENTYQDAAQLYIAGGSGEFLYSSEGTTQGDNIAMAFYALNTVPIIKQPQNVDDDIEAEPVKQVWFADDSSAAGSLKGILQWWKKLTEIGPKYGHNPNPRKCVLIVKNKDTQLEAQELLSEYGIRNNNKRKTSSWSCNWNQRIQE